MRASAAMVCAALVLASAPSRANGRFPLAQRVFEDPVEPNRLALSATFGLLLTGDLGQNWYYVCERAFAFDVIEGDALLEVLPDGTLLSGIIQALSASSDCGCNWQPVAAESAEDTVVDIAKANDGAVVALLRTNGVPASFRLERSA